MGRRDLAELGNAVVAFAPANADWLAVIAFVLAFVEFQPLVMFVLIGVAAIAGVADPLQLWRWRRRLLPLPDRAAV